jgi:hypothetical protein
MWTVVDISLARSLISDVIASTKPGLCVVPIIRSKNQKIFRRFYSGIPKDQRNGQPRKWAVTGFSYIAKPSHLSFTDPPCSISTQFSTFA